MIHYDTKLSKSANLEYMLSKSFVRAQDKIFDLFANISESPVNISDRMPEFYSHSVKGPDVWVIN